MDNKKCEFEHSRKCLAVGCYTGIKKCGARRANGKVVYYTAKEANRIIKRKDN